LTTVVFVLGWFAVGPERSLTNPHHGIGLAIYVLVIFQVLWGWFLHKRESKRQRIHVPLKLVVSDASRNIRALLTHLSYTDGWVVLLDFSALFKSH
jgi:cytochrome b